MTRTGRRGRPILDGAETAVAAARVAVSSAARSAFRYMTRSSDEEPTSIKLGKLRT